MKWMRQCAWDNGKWPGRTRCSTNSICAVWFFSLLEKYPPVAKLVFNHPHHQQKMTELRCVLHILSCGTGELVEKAAKQRFPWHCYHLSGPLGWWGRMWHYRDHSLRKLILGIQIGWFSFWEVLTTKLTLLSFEFKVLRSLGSSPCVLTLQLGNPYPIPRLPKAPSPLLWHGLLWILHERHVQWWYVASHTSVNSCLIEYPVLCLDAEVQALWVLLVLYWEQVLLYYKIRPKQQMQSLAEALETFHPTALFYFMLPFVMGALSAQPVKVVLP